MDNDGQGHTVQESPHEKKLAAVLPHACIVPVVFKVTHASPAKGILTGCTDDFWTASVLLDHDAAIWARLSDHDFL
jgi:hypothetical protein